MPNLPCPFCGSTTADVKWINGACAIHCALCGARGGALDIDQFGAGAEAMEKAAKRAWELWNERLPAAPATAAPGGGSSSGGASSDKDIGGGGGSSLKDNGDGFNGYAQDLEFARFVNDHLAGKTISRAWADEAAFVVHTIFIECTDGSVFQIQGEHDEAFTISRREK